MVYNAKIKGVIMSGGIGDHVPVVWSFRPAMGSQISGGINWFTPRVALKNPKTHDIIDRVALVGKKPLDEMPKNNLLNKFLRFFGYGWVVLKVQDPEGNSKYLQVKAHSLSLRIFEGKRFMTKGIDVTAETRDKLSESEPKPPYRDKGDFVRVYPSPLSPFLTSYSDVKDQRVDRMVLQGLRENKAIKIMEQYKKSLEPSTSIYLIYRDLEDNKLYLMQHKEGKCSRLSTLPEKASQQKIQDLGLNIEDSSHVFWVASFFI